uniref:hydroxyacylglutathione hydrolase, mitochondrial-like isoform X1 n=2 Tax=Styela clava TaxID=7725 RepID=UPI0019394B6D|nr:hydroxyacylglutathione hydrolase, mitochondrial-like isoform X1 [Styela clava]
MLRAVYHQLARSTAWYRYTTPWSGFHSTPQTIVKGNMKVKIIPALDDNYMYLITDEKTNITAAVDPVQPDKLMEDAKKDGLEISMVLTTHHHWDHAGGNKEIAGKIPKLTVYGGDDRIDALTNKVEHGSQFKIGSLSVECLLTPCHTKGHICYFIKGKNEDEDLAVFTGDTLFVGGCGKFFEGEPEQMYNALVKTLGVLPSNTKVYCGHEYTVSNLKYALHVEPENTNTVNKMEWAKEKRKANVPTVPSTIGEEFKFNPFMRVEDECILKYSKCSSAVEAMGFLRSEKNNFKPKM